MGVNRTFFIPKWPPKSKNGQKYKNFDFDGLELPENCNKPECYALC